MSEQPDDRTEPPYVGGEAEILLGFLEWHRATLLRKCEGLDAPQLAARLPPSSMTLGGLLTHLAFVEDYWCGYLLAGRDPAPPWRSTDWDAEPDADWQLPAAPGERHDLLAQAVARSRVVVADLLASPDGLASRSRRPRGEHHVSLRYVLVHLVEEYARHNGHADLLRESVDGAVGE